MNLFRDVLDQQIIDREQHKGGKVDGIALEIRTEGPPRVAYLDVGMDVLTRRFSSRLERLVHEIYRRFLRDRKPSHVSWQKVDRIAISAGLDIDCSEYSTFHVEKWLRDNIITKIPGNAHKKHQE
jgi:hypothetical protein